MTDSAPAPAFRDEELVYVDPDNRVVVARVEWNKNGNPKSLPIPPDAGKEEGKKSWRKFYPWGTYRSMKRIYRLEGKKAKEQPNITLDAVIEKALIEPFWD